VRANRWKVTVLSSLEVVFFRGAVTSSVRRMLCDVMLCCIAAPRRYLLPPGEIRAEFVNPSDRGNA